MPGEWPHWLSDGGGEVGVHTTHRSKLPIEIKGSSNTTHRNNKKKWGEEIYFNHVYLYKHSIEKKKLKKKFKKKKISIFLFY